MTHYEVDELRDALRTHYLETIERVGKAALAVPSEPRRTYKFRLAQAIISEAGNDLTERQVYTEFRNHPDLSHVVRVFHNLLVDLPLGALADDVDQFAQNEARNDRVLYHH